jgi:hypothetical protein
MIKAIMYITQLIFLFVLTREHSEMSQSERPTVYICDNNMLRHDWNSQHNYIIGF